MPATLPKMIEPLNEGHQPGLPFSRQDISRLNEIPGTASFYHSDWRRYKKKPCCARSIHGLNQLVFRHVEILADVIKKHVQFEKEYEKTSNEAQFWFRYKNLLGHLEEIMEDAYKELKRLVGRYTARYLFPEHKLYYICTYEKYNNLLDVLLNNLSVKLLIVNSLETLDKHERHAMPSNHETGSGQPMSLKWSFPMLSGATSYACILCPIDGSGFTIVMSPWKTGGI